MQVGPGKIGDIHISFYSTVRSTSNVTRVLVRLVVCLPPPISRLCIFCSWTCCLPDYGTEAYRWVCHVNLHRMGIPSTDVSHLYVFIDLVGIVYRIPFFEKIWLPGIFLWKHVNIILVDINLLNFSDIYVILKCSKQFFSAWHGKFGFLAHVL
jgi:hypothetical protein